MNTQSTYNTHCLTIDAQRTLLQIDEDKLRRWEGEMKLSTCTTYRQRNRPVKRNSWLGRRHYICAIYARVREFSLSNVTRTAPVRRSACSVQFSRTEKGNAHAIYEKIGNCCGYSPPDAVDCGSIFDCVAFLGSVSGSVLQFWMAR